MISTYRYAMDPLDEYNIILRTNATPAEIRKIINDVDWKLKKLEADDARIICKSPTIVSVGRSRYYIDPVRMLVHWRDLVDYPKFTKRLFDTNVLSGHSTWLQVRVTGDPKPEVRWYKDSLPLVETDRVKITNYEPGTYVLSIRDAMSIDQGVYTCRATNIAGSNCTSALVFVNKYRSPYEPLRFDFYDKLFDL